MAKAADIQQRLAKLREKMIEREISLYIVPTSDFHESEYVGEYFKARAFLTGFTGSAGTAVIGRDTAALWTDGRYFIQAAAQLKDTTVELMRIGEEGTPTIEEYIEEHLAEGERLGFDGRVINAKFGCDLKKLAEEKQGTIFAEEDLVGAIWEERPKLPTKKAWVLTEAYAGSTTGEKLAKLQKAMAEKGADYHILTSLYDIAWLLNVRGHDIDSVPVVLSYLAVTDKEVVLFVREEVLTSEVREHLHANKITIRPYHAIYSYAAAIPAEKSVLMDTAAVNYRICAALSKKVRVLDETNPTLLMKCIKNPVELANTRIAHIRDGVAFTKFMYWLKNHIGKEEITEISASDYLEARRREQEHFLELSFSTISAYGPNAAMMHYSASKESNAVLRPEGFLLVDSGGHYLEGTTDITRTIALGALTQRQKQHFTAVLRANLNLAAAKFLYGCRGMNLDILAREPLWELGIDYKCGTGHGVGHILNVHEGPNGFRWRVVQERSDSAVLEEGMITTDEPGVYLEGEYGIRTENELICCKGEKNEYGQFMHFETITYAPIDLDAVDCEVMSEKEKKLLNEYHRMVYEKLSPYLTKEEGVWLKEYTRAI